MATSINDLVESLGKPGKLQLCLGFLLSICVALVAIHHFSMVFMGAVPPHHCKVTDDFPLNVSIPTIVKNGQPMLDECHVFVDPTNHSLGQKDCTNGWTFLYERGERSVVGEFNLVCDSRYLVDTMSTIFFCGTMSSALLYGDLADRIGRKPVFLTNLYAQAVIGVAQYFSDSYLTFLIFKFLQGFLIQGVHTTSLCLIMELFPSSRLMEASAIANISWTVGQFVLVGLAYLLPNWKHLYLATTLPCLAGIVYIWIVPESLRWLLLKRNKVEALSVCQRFANFNKIQFKENLEEQIDGIIKAHTQAEGQAVKYDIRDLFRTKYIRRTTILSNYLWFANAFIYFGISFALPAMPFDDKYISFIASAGIEFVCRLLMYPTLKFFGRRTICSLSYLFTAICIAISAILDWNNEGGIANLIAIGSAMLARGVCSFTFVAAMLQATECFPTRIRSNAFGLGGLSNRMGSMIAPLVLILGDYIFPAIPFCLLGFVSFSAIVASYMMPETFGLPLPDTIEQVEQLCSKPKPKTISLGE